MTEHPKVYLFDLDGTLLDSAPDLAAAANHMRVVRGLEPLPFETLRKTASSGARGLLCAAFGIRPEDAGYAEMAKEFLNMGFYLGIGGVLTFNNAKKLKEVVAYMPLDRIVLETDCPYLSPVPNRGKRNSSLNLPYVVEEISRIKNVSVEQIIEITNRNAKQMYRLSL